MTINALTICNLRPRNRVGGDCVCLALTFLTNSSYFDIEELIKVHQPRYATNTRDDGVRAHGVYTSKLLQKTPIINGYRFDRVIDPSIRTVGDVCRTFSDGKFLVCTRRHALSVVNGQVFDAIDTENTSEVIEIWCVKSVA